jgi:hypothetical protein
MSLIVGILDFEDARVVHKISPYKMGFCDMRW